MTATKLLLFVLALSAAIGISVYTYMRLEPRGRGRPLLGALRSATLFLLILLLVDPHLKAGPRGSGSTTRVVLDASLSMNHGGAWGRAVAEARRNAGSQAVLIGGTQARAVAPDSLSALQPYAGESRMLPALQSAAEAGAQRVVLVTDGAIDDADDIARWLPTLGIDLAIKNVGGTTPANRAISHVAAPTWAEAGKPMSLRISVAASGVNGKAPVVVTQNGNEVARTDITLTDVGAAAATVTFNAQGPAEGGLVRYDVSFANNDSIPDDDVRSVYVFISDKPAGVAIVSFDPDWEPRFLHPVIADALGLPVRTFLRVPSGLYFRAGNGLEAGSRVDEADVRRAVREADLLVLHNLGPNAPAWANESARGARRLLVFPDDDGIQQPLATSTAVESDWYISADVPPSPLAPLLAGIDVGDLPPLTALQTANIPDGGWTPLLAGRTRSGGRAPVVVAYAGEGRRWAVALGRGYWRWAFRGGASHDAYARLWGALAGWIVQDQAQVAGAAIRPVDRAVQRGAPLRWIAPGLAADSFALALRDTGGRVSTTMMNPERGDTASSAPPAPGHYTYDIRAYQRGQEVARASGPLTVETYSPEFIRRPANLTALRGGRSALNRTSQAGTPLHTYSWLYVLLVGLLGAEWILRRRWGLR